MVDAFRAAYAKLGSPRLIIAVNRELVDSGAGLQLAGRKEKTESTRADYGGTSTSKIETVQAENTYAAATPVRPTLADRQTVRDIERLFGRPLRVGGAKLADQRIAAQLIADRPADHFMVGSDEAARKDREALAKIADVVLEAAVTTIVDFEDSVATVDAEETRFSCASIRAWRRQMRWAAEKSTDT